MFPAELHAEIIARFLAAFGAPEHQDGKNMQWSIRPAARMPAINVLVNICTIKPAVWVFDPHDLKNGVACHTAGSVADIDALAEMIKRRATNAGYVGSELLQERPLV